MNDTHRSLTAQIMKNYNRYNSPFGYLVFAFGFSTFLAKNIKDAKKWCESNGLDYIVVR